MLFELFFYCVTVQTKSSRALMTNGKTCFINININIAYVNFLQFLHNDDRMSSKRRNLSALVFLINSTTKVDLILKTCFEVVIVANKLRL